MTPAERAAEVRAHAELHGWSCTETAISSDGVRDGVYLVGTRQVDEDSYGFAIAFAVNRDTGRTIALRLDGRAGAGFAMTTGAQEWTGPTSAWRAALERPRWWTGGDDDAA